MLGRHILMTWDGAAIAGVRTKGIRVNGEAVDMSDDDSAGWRDIFSEAGEVQVDLSISGLVKDNRLQNVAFEVEDRIHAVVLTYPDGGIITGKFFLQNYSQTGEYKEYVTFDATLLSDGAIAFTPGT